VLVKFKPPKKELLTKVPGTYCEPACQSSPPKNVFGMVFKLPKGLTVADESQRGISAIGQFENNRFSIIITSNEDLVDYEINEDSLNIFSNFYSADINK
jgi:hypothetical protein